MNNLLDTCVFAEYQKKQPDEKVIAWVNSRIEETLFLSVLTIGEINKGIAKLPKSKRKTDQPIATTSENFSATNYSVVSYYKTAGWLEELEKQFGKEKFKKAMQYYFEEWKFKHPSPNNLQTSLKNILGEEVNTAFGLLKTKDILPGKEFKGFKIVSPFKKGSIKNYLRQPTKNILLLSPIAGINSYDRLMIGGLFTNYKLPPNDFQFLLG